MGSRVGVEVQVVTGLELKMGGMGWGGMRRG